jgi:hypothetical protein
MTRAVIIDAGGPGVADTAPQAFDKTKANFALCDTDTANLATLTAAEAADAAAIAALNTTVASHTTSITSLNSTTSGQATSITSLNSSVATITGKQTTDEAAITALQLAVGAAASSLTLAQLTTQYTTSNIVGFPQYVTQDAGLWWWQGTQWVQAAPYVLLQGGIPTGIGPSGSFANNGVWTAGTAIAINSVAYAACYLYFPGNSIFTGSKAGIYYTEMSTTTAGIVYSNIYITGNPVAPAVKTPFVCTGPGAYTQTTASVRLIQATIPANILGINGRLKTDTLWSNNNSAGTKSFNVLFGVSSSNSSIGNTENETTNTGHAFTHYIQNRGTGTQLIANNPISESVASFAQLLSPAADTTVQTFCCAQGRLTPSADNPWMMVESFAITVQPSTLTDNPPVATPTLASAVIVPPVASSLGYTVNKYFITPKVSDVSFTNDITKSLFPGLSYAQIPFLNGNAVFNSIAAFTDTPKGLQMNAPGIVFTGTAGAGTTTTTLVDSGSPGWATNLYYGSFLLNITRGRLVQISGNTGNTLTCAAAAGQVSGDSYAIVGAGGGFATQTQNKVAGAIPYLVSANGWYTEAAITLSSQNNEHWPAWWMLPQEHDVSNVPYLEVDIYEGGFNYDATNPFYGMRSNIANWLASGSLTSNNPGYTTNFDVTREHIYGCAYSPTAKKVYFSLDGIVFYTWDTTAYDTRINGLHYYVIMAPQYNTSYSGIVAGVPPSPANWIPYTMTCRYISGWSSV